MKGVRIWKIWIQMFQTGIFYQKNRQTKSLPKILCREIRTKNLRRVIGWLLTGQTLKINFFQRISLDESFSEISLKINLYQKISLEKSEDNFSTKNCLKSSLHQTNFNRNIHHKSVGRNISTTNSEKRNLYNTIFKRTPYQKIFENIILPKYIFKKNIRQTRCEKKRSTKQTLHRNFFQTNSKKPLPKNIGRNMLTRDILKTNLSEKGIWREISPQKIFQEFSRPLISKDSTKEIVKRHCLQKIEEKSLPKSLWRDISPPKKYPLEFPLQSEGGWVLF